ncbi:uncharacterized protein Dwil_GK11738 [Drosophila willistoni]|uniref:Amine oxidase n=1 Tax=Drosophila willistoni TaxID=7260 RepID=B4NAL0_DROWI|nr:putative flavin-containing monoamine oxidase AofH [Drosophila willistoni]EDW80824.1 uncharacterized protein Dwil_GK11738 [Drosophila willistoni]
MDLPFGTQTPELDVLIVGAGLSGLASAVKILSKEQSLKMKIIDENPMPGGQLGESGNRFVNSDQDQMITFLTYVQVLPHRYVPDFSSDSLRRCWDLDRGLTSLPARFELWRYINMLEIRMKKFGSKKFNLRNRGPTMERHICNNLFFNKSRFFMFNVVEIACGANPSDVDYDEFMVVCSSCGGLRMLIDLYFTFPSSLFEFSTRKLVDNIMEKIKFADMVMNCRATRVDHFKNYVEVSDSLGMKHTAQTVILAIPWNKVQKLEFNPPLPKEFQQTVKAYQKPRRVITQFYMRYPKSYWRSQGYSGHFLSSEPLVCGRECRSGIYRGYMMHTQDEVDEVKQTVLDLVSEYFGDEMQHPLEYQQSTFELNMALHSPQITPWHRVIWSSSAAVGTYYRNLMGGAVQSGVRAAVSALFVIRPQVVSWKDMMDVDEKDQYAGVNVGRVRGLLSRLNLYNVTFYSVFVLGIIFILNIGYNRSVS